MPSLHFFLDFLISCQGTNFFHEIYEWWPGSYFNMLKKAIGPVSVLNIIYNRKKVLYSIKIVSSALTQKVKYELT